MDIKARQEYTTPTAWNAAEMVFVDRGDGTAEMFVTSASGQPRRIVGLAVGGSNAGAPPPTSVTRTGALTSTQTYGSLSSVRQRFRPTVNIPVTGVQVDQITVSGTAAVAFHDLTTGQWVAAAAASQVGAGITATLSVLLLAGHEYFLHVGTLGNGVNGTDYPGYVSGVTLSSGHAWTGLTLTAPPTVFESSTPVQTEAQLAFQLLTGDMTGYDPSGLTIRGTDPVQVAYDAGTRKYTAGLARPLKLAGEANTHAFTASFDASLPASTAFRYRAEQATTLTGFTLGGLTPTGTPTARLIKPDGTVLASGYLNAGVVTFAVPAELAAGTLFNVEFQGGEGYLGLSTGIVPGTTSTDGALTYLSTYAMQGGDITENETDYGLCVSFAAIPASQEVQGRLPVSNMAPIPATHLTGFTAGQGVTLDRDEAAGTVTISATGGSGGGSGGATLPAPGTSGNVLTSDGTGWVSAAPPAGGGAGGALSVFTARSSPPSADGYYADVFAQQWVTVSMGSSPEISDPSQWTFGWTCPATGTYLLHGRLRIARQELTGLGAGVAFALGLHTSRVDGPWVTWGSTAALNSTMHTSRVMQVAQGDVVQLFHFIDKYATVYLHSAEFSAIRLA